MPEDIGQDFPSICRFLALQKIIILFSVTIYSLLITSHLIKSYSSVLQVKIIIDPTLVDYLTLLQSLRNMAYNPRYSETWNLLTSCKNTCFEPLSETINYTLCPSFFRTGSPKNFLLALSSHFIMWLFIQDDVPINSLTF